MVTERLGRAAIFTLGAAILTGNAAGCSIPVYGGPPVDSAVGDAGTGTDAASVVDAASTDDAGHDGGLAGAYGGPPVDASQVDTGGGAALYGAPPP